MILVIIVKIQRCLYIKSILNDLRLILFSQNQNVVMDITIHNSKFYDIINLILYCDLFRIIYF